MNNIRIYSDTDFSSVSNKILANDKLVITHGNEAFEYLNKVFYTMDKGIQNGIKGVINYFSTNNIYIENLEEYRTKTPNINTVNNLKNVVISKLKNNDKFYNISKKKTPVILGLNIDLMSLYNIINNNVAYVKGLEDTIHTFDTMLVKLLNSKKDNIVLDLDKSEINAITKQVESINKDLDKVTNKKVLKDRKTVGEIVSNYKELYKLTDLSLDLGRDFTMERLETIKENNDALVVKLSVIYESLKNNKTNMSKADLEPFVEYITNVAKLVTAVTFLFYIYYQLLNMLTAVIKIADTTTEDTSVIDVIALQVKKGNVLVTGYLSDLLK